MPNLFMDSITKQSTPYYQTELGKLFLGDSETVIRENLIKEYENTVQLLITSPPFPLNHKKQYGNLNGNKYKLWLADLGKLFSQLIRDDGSIVVEIGNAWEPGRPVQSTLHLESLLAFMESANLRLIQEFVCYNPSRLPTPAHWVTINRIRTVDSYTHVWWMAKSDFPKADNRKVLRPYSKSMKNLLSRKSYNAGMRPSGHLISENGFLIEHEGSIAHNLLEIEPIESERELRPPEKMLEFMDGKTDRYPENVLSLSNTNSSDYFSKRCREIGIKRHPATMHPALIAFFMHFLTDEGDLVLDPFAGSNTTGYVAEKLHRNWIGIEILKDYADQSKIRFEPPETTISSEG